MVFYSMSPYSLKTAKTSEVSMRVNLPFGLKNAGATSESVMRYYVE